MQPFKNFSEMAKYLQDKANRALKNEVAQAAKQEMSDTIKEVEYPKYISDAKDPYIRDMDEGGLSDVRNMQVEIIDDNTISITNERMDGGRDVATIFATGIGYSWKQSEIYSRQPFPRDFYKDTVERLLKNHNHVAAFKQGMSRLGIKVQ